MPHSTPFLAYNNSKRFIKIIFIYSPPKIWFLGHFPHFWHCITPCIAKNTQCDSLCHPPFLVTKVHCACTILFLLWPPLKFHCVTSFRSSHVRKCLIWTSIKSFYDFWSSFSLEQPKPAILDSLAFLLSGLKDKQTFQ